MENVLNGFLTVLGIIDNKQLDIFIYIAENTNQSNNLFIGTYKQIAKDVGVSEPTIAKLMKNYNKIILLKKINGVYIVNPNIMMKGNDTKRQILLSYYEEDKPLNSIEVLRGKQNALPEKEHSRTSQLLEIKE